MMAISKIKPEVLPSEEPCITDFWQSCACCTGPTTQICQVKGSQVVVRFCRLKIILPPPDFEEEHAPIEFTAPFMLWFSARHS